MLEKIFNHKVSGFHVMAFFAFSFLCPMFYLLSQKDSMPFFIAHNVSFFELVTFAIVASLGIPMFLLGVIHFVGKLFEPLGRALYFFLLAVFGVCFFLPLCDHNFLIAIFFSLLTVWFVVKFEYLANLVKYLSLAAVFSAGLFLISPNALSRLQQEEKDLESLVEPKASKLPNIVMVVFDQIPLSSLLNKKEQIRDIFPNFKYLSEHGTWYKNAYTMYTHTRDAIPSILTGSNIGKYRQSQKTKGIKIKNRTPDQTHFPQNLFTLFSDTHRLNIFESVTQLAPQKAAKNNQRRFSFADFFNDAFVIAARVVAKDKDFLNLPKINDRWKGFTDSPTIMAKEESHYEFVGERANMVEDFTQSLENTDVPSLNFLHVVLPHVPFDYDKDGNLHGKKVPISSKRFYTRLGVNIWGGEKQNEQGFRLHIEQLRFVDLLLGKIIQKLKTEGVYDNTALVVTADHGINFFWDDKTLPLEVIKDVKDLNMYNVPLMVKYPQQKKGQLKSEAVLTVDILPTLAKLYNKPVTWSLDGFALDKEGSLGKNNRKIPHAPKIMTANRKALRSLILNQQFAW